MALLALHWVGCPGHAQPASDPELGAVNRLHTPRFWKAVEQAAGPVTVLAFGDSMSASWQSVQLELFSRLQTNLGTSGYALQNFRDRTLWQYGGGAAVAHYNTNWWTLHGALPAGGFIFWTNRSDPTGSVLCDQVGVFWVAHAGGGSFALRVSTNGQSWSEPLLTLQGFSPDRVGRHASLPLPRGHYRLRVDGLSGTNAILGPQYLDRATHGVCVAFMAQEGAHLNQIFALPTDVLYPILAALNPQLVVYPMKELADIGELNLSNRLFALEALWQAGVTNGDVVYLGTPYDYRDATLEHTPRENRLLRQAALRDGRAYLDCMTPCGSYAAMVTNGFISDGIHPNKACNTFLADVIWPQLGFFALRADRQLTLTRGADALHLGWASATNLTYELQTSPNLADWTPLARLPGNGQQRHVTLPPPGATPVFFRLSLSPE